MSHRIPAVVVPDPGTWALWGVDLEALGITPAPSPAAASALALPRTVPAGLCGAVRAAWEAVPPPRRVIELEGPPLAGSPAARVLSEGRTESGAGEDRDESEDADEGEGGPGDDMMAITGEPSRDGLVMESIELEHGPLAPGLPGGLVLAVELDGDVVCRCEVRACLRSETAEDPLAPAASDVALWLAEGGSSSPQAAAMVIAIERERALSHLAWLSGFGVVLGWQELTARAGAVAATLIAAEAGDLEDALRSSERLLETLQGRRRLALRARGRGPVSRDLARSRCLRGPNARASGLEEDARGRSGTYRQLGFSVRTQTAGDAEARVLQRAGEAVDALELAVRAHELGGPASSLGGLVLVEGPRGPVALAGNRDGEGDGPAAARSLAGELARGLEWASALVVVASFDLSPWEATG